MSNEPDERVFLKSAEYVEEMDPSILLSDMQTKPGTGIV